MIRINLANRGTPNASMSVLGFLPWNKIFLGLLGMVVLYSVWIFRVNQVHAQTLARLTIELQTHQQKMILLDQRQGVLKSLQNRDAILKAIKSPQAQWSPRLLFLVSALVDEVWFTYLRYGPPDQKDVPAALSSQIKPGAKPVKPVAPAKPLSPVLVVRGSALVTTATGEGPVSQFIQNIKELPDYSKWFESLDLHSVEHRNVKQEEVSDFEIALRPKGG